jgi:hypothetical protein
MKPQVAQIFKDLEEYQEFCVEFGRPFREKDLYNMRSPHYQDYTAMKEGRQIRNHWFQRPPFDPARKKSANFRYATKNHNSNVRKSQ